jgi:hypothetical protein
MKNLFFSIFLTCCLLQINCMAKLDFENSGDTTSNAFLARGLLSQYLDSLILPADNSTSGEIPQYLAALVLRSGQSAGVRIFPVDSETGNLGSYQEYARTPGIGFAPGNSPRRIQRIPKTQELLVAGGAQDLKLYSFKVSSNGSVAPDQTSPAFGKPISFAAISPDGTKIFSTSENASSPPDQLVRYGRDSSSGAMTLIGTGGYPFGLTCGPRSLVLAPNGKNIFVNTNSTTSGLYGFIDESGTITQNSTTVTLPALITNNDNICIHPSKSFLYSTINLTSGPLVGFSYDTNSNLTSIPSSPFTPTANYTSTTSGSVTRTLAIDPLGKYVAFLYRESTTDKIQLLNIDQATGTLSPTNNSVIVGNSPNSLEWDSSGRFLYFVSDDYTNYQIEVFRVSKNGTLSKAPNSPFIITPMSGTGAIPISLTSLTKTATIKVGEYP